MAVRKHHIPTFMMYRKADVLDGSIYDEEIKKWQDWSFGITLLATRWRNGKKNDIHFIPGPHHSYRIHNYSTRISNISVSEEDMTKLTVKRNFDYFKNFYPDLNTADQISKHLVKIKRVFL